MMNLIFLGVLSIYDLKYRIAPDYISLPYITLGFINNIISRNLFILVNIIELMMIYLLLLVYSKVREKKFLEMFGGGDIKVLIGFSLMNSFHVFNFSLILGSIIGIAWGVLRKEKEVPFIVFLFAGYIISLFTILAIGLVDKDFFNYLNLRVHLDS
ncbi:MAG: prepilin peptidase [Brevinematia bacterium]